MDISVKRDGLVLRGDLLRPNNLKTPVAIIFHGLMSKRGSIKLTDVLLEHGIAVAQFDFNGHGKSDGDFSDMNVYNEILDAAKIMDYVRNLDFVTDIYVIGHSQGALVGGMIAGFYREYVKKLVMLAPAATIKDDAQRGVCFGIPYDIYNIPEHITMTNIENEKFNIGGLYFRLARTLPIYETTSMFEGETLIIHGSADEVVGVIGSKRYVECMKNTTLEIVDGENHGLNNFAWNDIVKKVLDFLK